MTPTHFVLRHDRSVRSAVWLSAALGLVGAWLGHWPLRANLFALLAVPMALLLLLRLWTVWQRERVIREAPLPQLLKRKLREHYPSLSGKDAELVERGLRQFFLACHRSKRQLVAMPSQAVDVMWHEFILHTVAYQRWCQLALGHFVHHTPAEALGRSADRNDGLRRAWFWACRDEAINPKAPTRLPLLFALDAKLGIPGGFNYVPDCRDIHRKSDQNGDASGSYCGGSFSDGSASGDSDGLGGSDTSGGADGDGGSDGGGDGGGCGGGGGD